MMDGPWLREETRAHLAYISRIPPSENPSQSNLHTCVQKSILVADSLVCGEKSSTLVEWLRSKKCITMNALGGKERDPLGSLHLSLQHPDGFL